MAHEPKKRHSRQRQGKRRASINFEFAQSVVCPNCSALHLPHHVCENCGFYKGQQVIKTKNRTEASQANV